MILADTSVWIDHLRYGIKEMREHLDRGHVVIHPFITAELALGSLHDRSRTLAWLDLLPQVRVAQTSEVRSLIESRRLYGLGIGITDAHLIASVMINAGTLLWTRDRPLRRAAQRLVIHADLT